MKPAARIPGQGRRRVPRQNTKGWKKGRAGPFLKAPKNDWVSAMPPPNPEHTCRPPLTPSTWTCPTCGRQWEAPRFDRSRKRIYPLEQFCDGLLASVFG